VSKELIAVHTGKSDVPFGQSGDSGAWVINAAGQLVGQQIAVVSDHNKRERFTAISPIRDVFRDNENLTGGKIELPVFRGCGDRFHTNSWRGCG
jgi:hypothetical protein